MRARLACGTLGSMGDAEAGDATRWTIHGERPVDRNRHIRLSVASVELPDGTRFEQYVARMPRCAMTVVLDEADRLLLIRRHRWIIDRWVWELPGGYADGAEDGAVAAAREVVEETGWLPASRAEFLFTYQPIVGTGDCPQDLYLVRGAEPTGRVPDGNETARTGWFTAGQVMELARQGEVVGAATIMGALHVLTGR